MKLRKKDFLILTIGFGLAIVLYIGSLGDSPQIDIQQFLISEVMVENQTVLMDEYGQYEDYIELYNGTNESINLNEYYLTDSGKELLKWRLPDVELKSGQYFIIFASGRDSGNHANFKLKNKGEGILLSHYERGIIQELVIEGIGPDISYGIHEKTGKMGYFVGGTPYSPNATAYFIEEIGKFLELNQLAFTVEGGVYNEAIAVGIETDFTDAVIRYTLDGTEPTHQSTLYEEAIVIEDRSSDRNLYASRREASYYALKSGDFLVPRTPVTKGTILKARLFIEDKPIGDAIVSSYFVFDEGKEKYSLPIVSLTTDPMNLYDPDKGIYVLGNVFAEYMKKNLRANVDGATPANYNQRGSSWNRLAYMEYFIEGQRVFEDRVAISGFGGWTRANVKKSLKIIATSYEQNSKARLEYPFISDARDDKGEILGQYKHLILRSGANDFESTMMRDEFLQSLAAEAGADTQGTEPVILFLNGEYWGIYHMRELQDKHYVEAHFPVKAEDVMMIRNHGEPYEGPEKVEAEYLALMTFFEKANLKNESEYQRASELVDIENFINYYLLQIYADNTDWPGNNMKMWKGGENAPEDYQKWRYLLYDMDFGFGLYAGGHKAYTNDTLSFATEPNGNDWPNPPWSTLILRKLLENDGFKQLFLQRKMDLLNTVLKSDYVLERISYYETLLMPEMDENIKRYNLYSLQSMEDWKRNLQVLKDFAKFRPSYMINHTIDYFELEGIAKVNIDLQGSSYGRVSIGTRQLEANDSLTNHIYLQGVPLEISVTPYEGYKSVVLIDGQELFGQAWLLELENEQSITIKFVK